MCVGDVERVQGNLVLIGVSGSCRSLFVGTITTLVDNYQLVDNSRYLIDQVRDNI